MLVSEVIKKAMFAGLGAQEKAREFVDELVKKGELSKSEGASVIKEWVSKAEESTKDIDLKVKDAISAAFEKLNIPSRADLDRMEKKIQALTDRIAKLEGNGKGGE